MLRTGNEPITARSPLRMRLWLSIWGLVWTLGGTAGFALEGRPGWMVACAALSAVIVVDLVVIIRHIRQGPHYQPGRDVPPYEPPRTRMP